MSDEAPVGQVTEVLEPSPDGIEMPRQSLVASDGTHMRLSLTAIASVCAVVATSCLVGLAVLLAVKDTDVLSTVALVLAIVAFTLQIMFFVSQTHASTEQELRGQDLHRETSNLLTEVKTTVASTEWMVKEQIKALLESVAQGGERTAGEAKIDNPDEFEKRLMSNIASTVDEKLKDAGGPRQTPSLAPQTQSAESVPQEVAPVRRAVRSTRRPSRQESARSRRRLLIRSLSTFPSEEESAEALKSISKLGPSEISRINDLAGDARQSSSVGSYEGISPVPIDEALVEAGIAERARHEGSWLTVLSDDGITAARLLTANGPVPQWAQEVIEKVDPPSPSNGFVPDADDGIPF